MNNSLSSSSLLNSSLIKSRLNKNTFRFFLVCVLFLLTTLSHAKPVFVYTDINEWSQAIGTVTGDQGTSSNSPSGSQISPIIENSPTWFSGEITPSDEPVTWAFGPLDHNAFAFGAHWYVHGAAIGSTPELTLTVNGVSINIIDLLPDDTFPYYPYFDAGFVGFITYPSSYYSDETSFSGILEFSFSGNADFELLNPVVKSSYLGPDLSLITPVPVPAALWLFNSALIGMAYQHRRKSKK